MQCGSRKNLEGHLLSQFSHPTLSPNHLQTILSSLYIYLFSHVSPLRSIPSSPSRPARHLSPLPPYRLGFIPSHSILSSLSYAVSNFDPNLFISAELTRREATAPKCFLLPPFHLPFFPASNVLVQIFFRRLRF